MNNEDLPLAVFAGALGLGCSIVLAALIIVKIPRQCECGPDVTQPESIRLKSK